ncbi:MAG: hypothetical protein ACI915_005298 [Gammaproteobacteria bacterium]|jgi:hypothetical protein
MTRQQLVEIASISPRYARCRADVTLANGEPLAGVAPSEFILCISVGANSLDTLTKRIGD